MMHNLHLIYRVRVLGLSLPRPVIASLFLKKALRLENGVTAGGRSNIASECAWSQVLKAELVFDLGV